MNPGEYLIEKRKQRLQTRLWSRKQPRGRKRFPSVEIQRQKFMKEQRACFQSGKLSPSYDNLWEALSAKQQCDNVQKCLPKHPRDSAQACRLRVRGGSGGQGLIRRTVGKEETTAELPTLDLRDLRGGWLRLGEPAHHQASDPARWGKREGTGATGCPPWGAWLCIPFPVFGKRQGISFPHVI